MLGFLLCVRVFIVFNALSSGLQLLITTNNQQFNNLVQRGAPFNHQIIDNGIQN